MINRILACPRPPATARGRRRVALLDPCGLRRAQTPAASALTGAGELRMIETAAMFPLRRVVDRKVEKYQGWVVTLDCGHRQKIDKKELPRERHRCAQCPPAENTVVERAPLRDVVSSGQDKHGVYEVLSCRHTLYGPPKRTATQRRCRTCLEEARANRPPGPSAARSR
jgi:hypothetical protein